MRALTLRDGCVDLWYALPEAIADVALLDRYRALLPPEEAAEEKRFAFERDRRRFLLRRALVRTVLSEYTGVDPRAWTFRRNQYGKPEVDSPADVPLRFNLSHTEGLVVCAVARQRDVGVDVEQLDRRRVDLEVARQYFAPAEIASLKQLPEPQRPEAFFQLWTLKEAHIKARGMGLSIPLDDFAFTLSEHRPPALSFAAGCDDDSHDWQFAQVRLGGRHQIAVAIRLPESRDLTIRMRQTVPLVFKDDWQPLPRNASNWWFV